MSYTSVIIPPETPEMTNADRQALLDVLICFYNFDDNKPSNGGELMSAWERARRIQDEKCKIYWKPDEIDSD